MTAHLADSTMYGHLWSTPETHRLFDEDRRVQSWLDILSALANAQARLGIVPAEAARSIGEHAKVELLDLRVMAERTRATGHSTLGLIQCLRDVLPPHAREWVYFGATVQDLTDTWTALVMRQMSGILTRDLSEIVTASVALARRHRDTVMCGRTHGQPGLPITFGFKAAGWVSELRRHQDRLAEGRRRFETVQLGGALGTMEFWGERAQPLLAAFASELGLAVPDIAWLNARDRFAEFSCLLSMVAGTLGRIGQEVYALQRLEIGELAEPAAPDTVGSITMPHKRNPELSEHLVTLGRVVRAGAGTALEAMIGEHERDGRAWKTEWVVLPEMCMGTAAALALGRRLLDGLEVDPARMRENLDARGGYPMSEPVVVALASRMGKHVAQQLVHEASMAGRACGVTLREALLADPRIATQLDDRELDALLTPDRPVAAAAACVDRAVSGSPR